MASVSVTVGGTSLPAGKITAIKRSDELLWSDGTGRAANSGLMTGTVVAKKQTYTLEFGPLTASEYATVRSVAGAGFVSLSITVGGATLASCTVYRGTITGELLGVLGGTTYYKGVQLELVER